MSGGTPEPVGRAATGGDFKYDLDVERQFVEDILLPSAGWSAGVRVVEARAGKCHHAEILCTLGFAAAAEN